MMTLEVARKDAAIRLELARERLEGIREAMNTVEALYDIGGIAGNFVEYATRVRELTKVVEAYENAETEEDAERWVMTEAVRAARKLVSRSTNPFRNLEDDAIATFYASEADRWEQNRLDEED